MEVLIQHRSGLEPRVGARLRPAGGAQWAPPWAAAETSLGTETRLEHGEEGAVQ